MFTVSLWALLLTIPPANAAQPNASQVRGYPTTQPTSRPTSRPALSPPLHLQPKRIYTLQYNQFYRIQQTSFGEDTKVLRRHIITFQLRLHRQQADGSMILHMNFQRVQMHITAGPLRLRYDSKNRPQAIPAQAHILAALVGHHMLVTLTPHGEVRQVSPSAALRNALKQAIHSHPIFKMLSGAPRAAMTRQFDLQYGPRQWQRELGALWSYLPPHTLPTKPWRRITQAPLYGMTQNARWHITQRTPQTLHLSMQGTLRTPKDGITPFDVGSTTHMRYAIKGQTKATMILDATTRLPLSGRIQLQLSGKIIWMPPPLKKPRKSWPLMLLNINQYQP